MICVLFYEIRKIIWSFKLLPTLTNFFIFYDWLLYILVQLKLVQPSLRCNSRSQIFSSGANEALGVSGGQEKLRLVFFFCNIVQRPHHKATVLWFCVLPNHLCLICVLINWFLWCVAARVMLSEYNDMFQSSSSWDDANS